LGEDFDPGIGGAGLSGRVSSSEDNDDTIIGFGRRQGDGFPDAYSPSSRFNGAAAADGAYSESSSHADDWDVERARGRTHESWRGPPGSGQYLSYENPGADVLEPSRGGSAAWMHAGIDANRGRRGASELGYRPHFRGDDPHLGDEPRAVSPPGPALSDQEQDRPGDKPFRLLTPQGWVNWDWNSALANARTL